MRKSAESDDTRSTIRISRTLRTWEFLVGYWILVIQKTLRVLLLRVCQTRIQSTDRWSLRNKRQTGSCYCLLMPEYLSSNERSLWLLPLQQSGQFAVRFVKLGNPGFRVEFNRIDTGRYHASVLRHIGNLSELHCLLHRFPPFPLVLFPVTIQPPLQVRCWMSISPHDLRELVPVLSHDWSV